MTSVEVININSDRHYFNHIIDVKNAPVPVLHNAEVNIATTDKYTDLLSNVVRPYLRSNLPFKTKLTWTIRTSGGDGERDFHRPCPSFTFMSTGSPSALQQYVANILREYLVALEYIEGSGWTVIAIPLLRIALTHLAEGQVSAGSYIETPPGLMAKRAVVNVKMEGDNCFILHVCVCLRFLTNTQPAHNPDRLNHYLSNATVSKRKRDWVPEIDTMGLDTSMLTGGPVTYEEIEVFEQVNQIGIYIWDYKDRHGKMGNIPWSCLRRAPLKPFQREVVLVLLEKNGKQHFVACVDFRKLRGSQGKDKKCLPLFKPDNHYYHCHRCGSKFTTDEVLQRHLKTVNCLSAWKESKAVLPEKESEVQFEAWHDLQHHHFVAVADFEMSTLDNGDMNTVVSAGFHVEASGDMPEHFEINRGPDPARWLIIRLMQIAWDYLKVEKELQMSKEEEEVFKKSKHCWICRKPFYWGCKNKVRDHDHRTGKFRGAAHQRCNTKLHKDTRMIVLFHNMEGFDSVAILRTIAKMQNEPQFAEMRFDTLQRNMERTISINFGPLQFRDSFHHLRCSLAKNVSVLLHSGPQAFPRTLRCHKWKDFPQYIISKLEWFPYSLLGKWDRRLDTLTKDDYTNKLGEKEISDEQFAEQREMYQILNVTTIGELNDVYLSSDVLTLADSWSAYRNTIIEHTRLDPCYSMTLPTLSWKYLYLSLKDKIELLTVKDEKIAEILDAHMYGGLVVPFQPYAKTSENVHIKQFDVCSLYPTVMAEYLPVGRWTELELSEEEAFEKIRNWDPNGQYGYAFLVDHWAEESKHDEIDLAPFARIPTSITELSEEQQDLYKMLSPVLGPRITPTLGLVTSIFLDVSILQLYLRIGVSVRIKQSWQYLQAPVFRDWILTNYEKKKNAKSKVERECHKLTLNAIYGMTLHDVSKHKNSRMYVDKHKWLVAASHPISDFCLVSQEPFIGMAAKPRQRASEIKVPRYIGWAILQRSKAYLYKMHYDGFREVFGTRQIPLYCDTDSMAYRIESEDLEADLAEFTKKSPIKLGEELGELKDEARELTKEYGLGEFDEYCGLAPKLYALRYVGEKQKDIMKARGVPKHKLTSFDDYRKFQLEPTDNQVSFYRIKRLNQSLSLEKQTKRSIAGLNTKTFHTHERDYPLGHYKTQGAS